MSVRFYDVLCRNLRYFEGVCCNLTSHSRTKHELWWAHSYPWWPHDALVIVPFKTSNSHDITTIPSNQISIRLTLKSNPIIRLNSIKIPLKPIICHSNPMRISVNNWNWMGVEGYSNIVYYMSFTNYISLCQLPIKHSNEICPSKMEVSVGKSSKWWISAAELPPVALIWLTSGAQLEEDLMKFFGSRLGGCGLVPKMWLAHGP